MNSNHATDITADSRSNEGRSPLQRDGEVTPSKAIEVLIHHFNDHPDDAVALNDMGVLHANLGHTKAALDCYRRAHQLTPSNPNFAKNLADLLFVEFGDLHAAMELYLGVLRRNSDDCDSLLAIGHISAAVGRSEDARQFYTRVCEIEPGHPLANDALSNLGMGRYGAENISEVDVFSAYETLLERSRGDLTLAEMQAFADRHPSFALVFNDMGVVASQSGNSAQAEIHYRRAVELEPTNTTFLKNLGDHQFVMDGHLHTAADTYVKVLELDATDIEALHALYLISKSTGNDEEAAFFSSRVNQLDPDYTGDQQSLSDRVEESALSSKRPPLLDEEAVTEHASTTISEIANQPKAFSPGKKKTDVSVYVIVREGFSQGKDTHEGFSLIKRGLSESVALRKEPQYNIVASTQWAQSDPLSAASVRDSVGGEHYFEAAPDRLISALSECLSSDPNPYIALISDDVWVANDWLEQLKMHLDTGDQAAIVGPLSNFANGVQYTDIGVQATFQDFESFAAQWLEAYRHRRINVAALDGSCVLFTKKALVSIGPLDDELPLLEAAIGDWCLRARLAGLNAYAAGDTVAFKSKAPSSVNKKPKWLAQKWNRLVKSDPRQLEAFLDQQAIDEAKKAYHSGGLSAALEVATSGKDIRDLSTASLLNLVELCVDARQFEEAGRYIGPLCDRGDDSRHLVFAGLIKEGLGETDAAEVFALKALQKEPQRPEAMNLMGVLAYAQGDSDKAGTFFRQAVESDPGYGDPYANLATMKWPEDPEAAFELYKVAFNLSPHKADVVELFQMSVAQLGRHAVVIPLVLEAIKRYPKVRLLRSLAIEIYLRLGDLDAAMDQVADVLCNFPLEEGFLDAALKIRQEIGGLTIEQKTGSSPSLALGMIVKDEAANVARCLSSVTGLVDEIIVVDTGSSDMTREIATVMGARIVDYKWNDSFADARNIYLKAARADWILVLDADEVVAKKDHQSIRDLIEGKEDPASAFTITTRNYDTNPTIIGWTANAGEYPQEECGSGWIPTDKVRLFPNDERLYYSFPVHEMIEPALKAHGYEMKKTDIPVHHYGKLDALKTKRKHDFYYQLGQHKLSETGDNAYALRELAIQAGLLEKYDEAIDLWQRFLALKPNIPEAYINMGTAHFHLADFSKAYEMAKLGYEVAPHFRESLYNYALMSLHIGKIDAALELGQQLADENPDYLPGVFFYVCACFASGDRETGEQYLQSLSQTSLGPVLSKSFETFCKGLSDAGQNTFVRKINAAI